MSLPVVLPVSRNFKILYYYHNKPVLFFGVSHNNLSPCPILTKFGTPIEVNPLFQNLSECFVLWFRFISLVHFDFNSHFVDQLMLPISPLALVFS